MTQLVTFDLLTRQVYEILSQNSIPTNPSVALGVSVSCGLIAAVASSLASQPGDSLLSEINKGGSTFGTSALEIMGGMGPTDYFRGTRARLVHMMAIVTTQLVCYDVIKQLVGLSATGAK
eukprot:CAMPEP_0184301150 /NCGR_PEP_ID=MMETSP1049-20130417/11410_1 /TAXON_ID=77928 /ORGANISM="Proteomonas sulcata, Strain CCMP704" /LENGTH=119 /DNA_ID=CAMNT_0026612061 /DNA_START=28 /DNA_END=387 /DNA_ORIENTATION=+